MSILGNGDLINNKVKLITNPPKSKIDQYITHLSTTKENESKYHGKQLTSLKSDKTRLPNYIKEVIKHEKE